MKIQKKSKMIIGICIFIGAILFMVFHLKEKKEPVVFKRPPIAEAQNNVNSMTADELSDLYCGIVLMPKSMVSTIEQLSKHKLAKDIKLLPARIEWDNGCMVAIPEETVFAYDNAEVDDTRSKDLQFIPELPEEFAGAEIKKIHPALFYLFLANVSKSQINY
jgi:hypothetical protein